ncbi:MAG: TIGR00725 family protein [Armatimonadetes bacterium]|nr:TIGR00725 family protein [Armatimonadota bacterium]
MVYVGIIGDSRCDESLGRVAYDVGRGIAERGAVLVCGGLGGVMSWSARGARENGGTTLGMLPGTDRKDANPYIVHAVPTGLGEARNLLVVRASDALIAISGGYGTLSELAFALLHGKPVVGLSTWRLLRGDVEDGGVAYAGTAALAVQKVFSLMEETCGRGA